ncbi:M14 family zinc carboxypeptidase [Candidatus Leptofilum sp.]|uniref:M14 family metallopeptidase n=1 Tax=Candidatus Leptofilum sp. TaxID=3241576 RepID=UPI003B5C2242
MAGRVWILLACLGIILAGCSVGQTAVPTQLPTVAVLPTEVAQQPTLLPTATFAPLPATQTAVPTSTTLPTVTPVLSEATAVPQPTATFAAYGVAQTIGTSVNGRPIESYRFGFGSQTIVLVGGIHGGYEWNTIILAYNMIDYFLANPDQIPANISLYIIPSANPDGQYVVTGVDGRFTPADVSGDIRPGRFNGNQVDLNRNWACDWQAEGLWGDTVVSGGAVPFSEPETAALRTFFLREQPAAVLFWHSKADGIFVGSCDGTFQPSAEIAEIYGRASGYTVYSEFSAYPITGDASDWLATQNIPSFTVELKTRNGTDWEMNLDGVLALLDFYGR